MKPESKSAFPGREAQVSSEPKMIQCVLELHQWAFNTGDRLQMLSVITSLQM